MLVVLLLIGRWISPTFFDINIRDGRLYGNLIDVFNRGAPIAILAVGMVAVIGTGGIDLSVGAVIAITGAVAAILINAGYPAWQVIVVALVVGLVCGVWNGALVAVVGMQPFVATLILMVCGRGIAQMITQGKIETFVNQDLAAISLGTVFSIPMPIIISFSVLAVGLFLFRFTSLGMFVEAIGINRRSTNYTGVNTVVILFLVYVWAGFCSSVSGLIVATNILGADANNAGLNSEMDAILAVVIGGTSLMGGRFSVVMTFVGALIIQAINADILTAGFQPHYNLIIKAVLILIVLLVQSPALKSMKLLREAKGRKA
ncbi:MAG: ABC transporter permease [Methylobacteriaceae bacterium]|nr:ABC transporter permease [Methylobacteriaceae bacterium]